MKSGMKQKPDLGILLGTQSSGVLTSSVIPVGMLSQFFFKLGNINWAYFWECPFPGVKFFDTLLEHVCWGCSFLHVKQICRLVQRLL